LKRKPVAFQLERFTEILPELRPLFPLLWDDVAVDKERFVVKCDEPRYLELDRLGMLHLVTAREGEKLIGYFLMLVWGNPHYADSGPMGFTDMYFIRPEYRKGSIGVQLFTFMEDSLKARGVVKMYTSHKVHRDRSRLMTLLGWKAVDVVYSKVIG
jgi:GNAT superfamily N-acetyltransferase